jgi:hypothetical protein
MTTTMMTTTATTTREARCAARARERDDVYGRAARDGAASRPARPRVNLQAR